MLSLQFYATVNVIVIVFLTLRKLSNIGPDVSVSTFKDFKFRTAVSNPVGKAPVLLFGSSVLQLVI